MPLKPLDTPSLSEQAYIAIKDSVLSLELPPGETLGIGDLADKLGVAAPRCAMRCCCWRKMVWWLCSPKRVKCFRDSCPGH